MRILTGEDGRFYGTLARLPTQGFSMIQLRPLRPDEFKDYNDYFVNDYGAELHSNYGTPALDAKRRAQVELDDAFPDGVAVANHALMAIDCATQHDSQAAPKRVGFLWYELNLSERRCFIMDIYIAPAHRSAGFGSEAMHALEKILIPLNIDSLQLRVAHDNPRALALYQRLGFNITGINLAKHLTAVVRTKS